MVPKYRSYQMRCPRNDTVGSSDGTSMTRPSTKSSLSPLTTGETGGLLPSLPSEFCHICLAYSRLGKPLYHWIKEPNVGWLLDRFLPRALIIKLRAIRG